MAIKKTLLEIVQSILSDMDSEDVNSVTDSVEAQQIASIVEDTFYDFIADRSIPEHHELLKMTALSDSDYPTHFNYPDNVKEITELSYDKSDDGTFEYKPVKWMEPTKFLELVDGRQEDYDNVSDKNAGTNLRILNNRMPYYYTSFDDYYIVMDAYDSDIDTTLQESKVRAIGIKYPVFDRTDDTYVPDIDGVLHPMLLAEAKSTAISLLKGGPDFKIEQHARRHKSYSQNDKHRTRKANNWSNYGRN